MATAPHHQQVYIELAAFFYERIGNFVFLADGTIFDAGGDALRRCPSTPPLPSMPVLHDEDADLSRMMQIGE